MVDYFHPSDHNLSAPARRMFTITPSNTVMIDPLPKAVRFNGTGTLKVRAVDSEQDVTIDVVPGEVLPVRLAYIRTTGLSYSGTIHGFS